MIIMPMLPICHNWKRTKNWNYVIQHYLTKLIIRLSDEEDNLLQGINQYRTSLNLTALTKSDRAECLADEVADQFSNQPCTNSTGSNTVPGTEPQYGDFPNILRKCHLNVTTTRDGQIMPACVPNLQPDLVLSNFTLSQYSRYLNDTQYTGIGIGSDENWVVVVLTTSTPQGDYSQGSNSDNGASSRSHLTLIHAVLLLAGVFALL